MVKGPETTDPCQIGWRVNTSTHSKTCPGLLFLSCRYPDTWMFLDT